MIVDTICILIIISYEWKNFNFKTMLSDTEDIQNKNSQDIQNIIEVLNYMKILKGYLIFFATYRIINYLKLSFFVNFFTRVFYKFYRKYFNLYLFPCWSIFVISVYFYADNNSINLLGLTEAILYVRKSVYDNINQKEYKNASVFIISVNFAVLIFLKVFVFSLIFAGIKTVYYEEIENYKKCQKKFKGKLLGDFLFFWILAPFHYLYYITKGIKDFNNAEKEIIETIIEGLQNHGGQNKKEFDKITKENIDKHSLEKFYSFFQIEGDDIKIFNKDFLSKLKSDYFMEKIQLEKRDVYVIGKR